MKLFNFLSLFLGLSLLSCGNRSRADEVLQTYPTGEVLRRHTEIDGKKEGTMTEYNKDGSIRYERFFENDLQVGRSMYYYAGGAIKEVHHHVNGKKEGTDTLFYPDGRLQSIRDYHEDQLHGYLRKWDTLGVLIYEARFAHDTLVEVKGEPVKNNG